METRYRRHRGRGVRARPPHPDRADLSAQARGRRVAPVGQPAVGAVCAVADRTQGPDLQRGAALSARRRRPPHPRRRPDRQLRRESQLVGAGRAGPGRDAAEHRHAQDVCMGGPAGGTHDGRRHLRDELRVHARPEMALGLPDDHPWHGGDLPAAVPQLPPQRLACSQHQFGCAAGRLGSDTSTPSLRHASRIASAPLQPDPGGLGRGDRRRRQKAHRVAGRVQRQVSDVAVAQQHRGERRAARWSRPQRRAQIDQRVFGSTPPPRPPALPPRRPGCAPGRSPGPDRAGAKPLRRAGRGCGSATHRGLDRPSDAASSPARHSAPARRAPGR